MKKYMGIVLPIVIGGIAFCLVVGPRVFCPENISWLGAGDPVQHFLGWQFFRDAAWTFPLGLNPTYGLELSNGVAYSDSIPLLAIPLKLISSLLPQPFQYFGLWLLACFVLQVWFGWKLAGLASENVAIRGLAAALFVFSPPMLWRLHGHLSLVGHFLILAALYFSLRPAQERRKAAWAILIAVAALVHAYILAMVLLLWLADIVTAIVGKTRTCREAAWEIAVTFSLLLLVCWQAGYFSVGGSASGSGYGHFRMNVLSVIDASGWSSLLKDLPEGPGDYEGFNYLGLGVLFAVLFALPRLLTRKVAALAILKRRFFFVLTLSGLTLFAITNKIGVGSLNFKVSLPAFVLHYANIFRSSGRMFWPVFYVILFAAIFTIVRGYGKKTAIAILAATLMLQVYDTSAGWSPIRSALMVAPASTWTSPLQDPFWKKAAEKYKNVRMIMPRNSPKKWNVFATYAARHHLGTDSVYMARIDNQAVEKARDKSGVMLADGSFDQDSLYIVDDLSTYPAIAHATGKDLIARIDGFTVVAPGWKRCADCPREFAELQVDAVLGTAVDLGQRLAFGGDGKGQPYLYGDWSLSGDEGVLSAGLEAGLLIPLTVNNAESIAMELKVLPFKKPPKQRVEFYIDNLLINTAELTNTSGDVVTLAIPDAVKNRLEKRGFLDISMKFPDAIRLLDYGYDDIRKIAIQLVAVTIH
ncbi:MAG: DUF6311 domain-containing protein [Solidesulfovibrio sp.]